MPAEQRNEVLSDQFSLEGCSYDLMWTTLFLLALTILNSYSILLWPILVALVGMIAFSAVFHRKVSTHTGQPIGAAMIRLKEQNDKWTCAPDIDREQASLMVQVFGIMNLGIGGVVSGAALMLAREASGLVIASTLM